MASMLETTVETSLNGLLSLRKFFNKYFHRLSGSFFEVLLLVCTTAILNFILLSTCEIMWAVYKHTFVGQNFIRLYPDHVRTLDALFSRNSLLFSINLIGTSFIVCITVGAVCQLLELQYHFYHSQGLSDKIFFWGLPLSYIAGGLFEPYLDLGAVSVANMSVPIAAIVSLVPTLCLFSGCFRFAANILPEIGTMVSGFYFGERVWFIIKQAILVAVLSNLVNIIFLYLFEIIWMDYDLPPMAYQLFTYLKISHQDITAILSRNHILFSSRITCFIFIGCLVFSIICQLFNITRYFYIPGELVKKTILWGLPLATINAFFLKSLMGIDHLLIAIIMFLPPTVCIFEGCFAITNEIIP